MKLLLIFCFVFVKAHGDRDPTLHPNWHLFDHETCGESVSDRIIGGSRASLGQFPWMARLGYRKSNEDSIGFKCGGSLINNMYVLTAAHCLVNLGRMKLKVVRLGDHRDGTDPDCEGSVCAPPVQDFKPASYVVHSRYHPGTMKNDIGLIRLNGEAQISEYVTPICLPHGPLLRKNYIGSIMELAGWGVYDMKLQDTSPVLLHVRVPVLDSTVCNKLDGIQSLGAGQICAGGKKGKDSCGGDSGGPLMIPEAVDGPPKYYVIGVVSFGSSNCGSPMPAVYTKVGYYIFWILKNVSP